MAEVIRMPLLSDTMKEGKIIAWMKDVGEHVESDDILAEVETDKAVMEVVGYEEGTLLYQGVKAGESAAVNQIIAIVGEDGEDYQSLLHGEDAVASVNMEPAAESGGEDLETSKTNSDLKPEIDGVEEILMPLLSDTMKEGKIVSWLKDVGDAVSADDVLAEVETDKATMEVVGYADGYLLYRGVEEGGSVPVNGLIAVVGPKGADVNALIEYHKNHKVTVPAEPDNPDLKLQSEEQISYTTLPEETNTTGRIKASPLAKKIAKEKGINLSAVKGTGPHGRIVKKDVENYTPISSSAAAGIAQDVKHTSSKTTPYTDVPVSQMRSVIASRLAESKFAAPHFYLTTSIEMDEILSSRKKLNALSKVKISVNDLIVKFVAMALKKHPDINSSWLGDVIRINHHINVGIAVAIDDGLIVPVIRDADEKSLEMIAQDSNVLIEKAKERKLQPEEFTGNTFTISNLGMMGIEQFTAIINPPDACILAVGATTPELEMLENGEIVRKNKMKVTLSCDHRVVDGASGARFLQTLKEYMENPLSILL